MFERFTDRARRVVVLAQEEARLLNHNYIGTEHILLGLIHEGEGVAAKALESLGISLEAVRSQVEEIIGQGGSSPSSSAKGSRSRQLSRSACDGRDARAGPRCPGPRSAGSERSPAYRHRLAGSRSESRSRAACHTRRPP